MWADDQLEVDREPIPNGDYNQYTRGSIVPQIVKESCAVELIHTNESAPSSPGIHFVPQQLFLSLCIIKLFLYRL